LKKMRVAFHSAGSLGEFKDSLLRLDLRLRTSPTDLGEMCWARGSVQQHVAALRPVAINFAVDKSRKIVFVTSAHALAGPGAKE
jgi:hypothetical protein